MTDEGWKANYGEWKDDGDNTIYLSLKMPDYYSLEECQQLNESITDLVRAHLAVYDAGRISGFKDLKRKLDRHIKKKNEGDDE